MLVECGKSIFVKSLVSEIEHHFDDVLRAKLIKIVVTDDNSRTYECHPFNFESLPGVPLKREIPLKVDGSTKKIAVDLKILDRVQDNRLPVLTNKQRRIQAFADLKSYKNCLRIIGESVYVWANPFVVGSIEINDICSPNLTRDDLRDSPAREMLYEQILVVQKELQELVDSTMNKKTQESFKKLGNVMSDCLSRLLRSFKLQFEQVVPSGKKGQFEKKLVGEEGEIPFGGDEPGGGGPGANEKGSGGLVSIGKSGVGDEASGGGDGSQKKGSDQGTSEEQTVTSPGPRIEFQNHAGEGRIIDLGNSLIINTQHPDFIQRNASKSGTIKLDARLLNYVSLVIAAPCVHRLFERKGKVPTVLEAGTNIVDLSMKLEQELISTVLGEEIERTI